MTEGQVGGCRALGGRSDSEMNQRAWPEPEIPAGSLGDSNGGSRNLP